MQRRLASAIDHDLQPTQFGFRAARSTSIPITCIKRVVEKAYASQDPAILVFLDWEKAFDRIRQDKLMECLERMNVDPKMIKAIRSLYSDPTFAVEIGTKTSEWYKQERGIRQGCPLSPYLFLIVMTVLCKDVHAELNLSRGILHPLGYSELRYADDTVLITNNVNAMNRLLEKIEHHAAYYGLKFNQNKCVALTINTNARPQFANCQKVHFETSTIYLGANINKQDDSKLDMETRLGACFAMLNKLNFFWSPIRFKLNVFDAVIRSKLLHSLKTVHLTPSLISKLECSPI